MKNFYKLSTFLVMLGLSSCGHENYNNNLAINEIQDTAAATNYFRDELNFTTNPVGLKSIITQNNSNFTVIDLRREAAFKAGHIPGAINMPFDKYESFESNQSEFPQLRMDGFNYVYCYELLCNLSQKAAKKFTALGYPTKEIKGGFQSWKEHKYPVEK